MLEFQHISVTQPTPILDNISFALSPNRIHTLIGLNGVGKSTLLRCVLGDVRYRGQILLHGKPLTGYSPRERAVHVSILPQLLPSPMLSVREVVSFGFHTVTTRLSDAEWATVDHTLDRLQIAHLADRLVAQLSGGERQKVFLAMTFVQNAPILLLDEPTAYMDPSFKSIFFDLLREECANGKTILLVLHDLADAVAISDRILLLKNGRLTFDGLTSDCLQQQIIENAFSVSRYESRSATDTQIFFR